MTEQVYRERASPDFIRVVVVAPTLALRAGFRALLGDNGPIDVIGEGGSLQEVHPLPADTEVLVVAAESAGRSDLERELGSHPALAILLLASHESELPAWFSGPPLSPWGILPLDCSSEELVAAVVALHQGLVVAAPAFLEPMLVRMQAAETPEMEALVEPLTERESQVLHFLAQGLANKQIAKQLGISEHTVKFHVSAIYSKLEATNRTEAVRHGVRKGLITL